MLLLTKRHGILGAFDLVNRSLVDRETVILAPEPNSLTLTIEHKGVVWYEIEAVGKSAHAGNPKWALMLFWL